MCRQVIWGELGSKLLEKIKEWRDGCGYIALIRPSLPPSPEHAPPSRVDVSGWWHVGAGLECYG